MQPMELRPLAACINSHADRSPVVHGFDKVAHSYDSVRPDYPTEALDQFFRNLNPKTCPAILDLACGSGKLTKALLQRGFKDITAVDPADDMVKQCQQRFAEVLVKKGVAEAIPLETCTLDAVFVGTAFHWFDGDKALNEIARVLVRNGRLGLIWNMLNPEVSWVSKIRGLLDVNQKNENHDTLKWKKAFDRDPRFAPLHHATHHYTIEAPPEALINCLLSFKAVGNMTNNQIEKIKNEAYAILANDPVTSGKALIKIPYRVEMYWTYKIKNGSRSHINLCSLRFDRPIIPAYRSLEGDAKDSQPS